MNKKRIMIYYGDVDRLTFDVMFYIDGLIDLDYINSTSIYWNDADISVAIVIDIKKESTPGYQSSVYLCNEFTYNDYKSTSDVIDVSEFIESRDFPKYDDIVKESMDLRKQYTFAHITTTYECLWIAVHFRVSELTLDHIVMLLFLCNQVSNMGYAELFGNLYGKDHLYWHFDPEFTRMDSCIDDTPYELECNKDKYTVLELNDIGNDLESKRHIRRIAEGGFGCQTN